jgi:sialate O-acetylesterase
MRKKIIQLLAVTAIFLKVLPAVAEVAPNSMFSEHGILQRDMIVPVWGTARDGEKITVEFNGQKVKTVATDGKWMVKLKKMKAGGPFVMTITGDNVVTINDILVGEVWLCSGQSNMGFRMSSGVFNAAQEIAEANYPEIREFVVSYKPSHVPIADTKGKWLLCNPANVKDFTAVGYFFARDLYQKMHIPFGIIYSTVGGTPAEFWTSREAMEATPELKQMVNQYDNGIQTYPMRLAKFKADEPALTEKYNQDLLKYNQDMLDAKAEAAKVAEVKPDPTKLTDVKPVPVVVKQAPRKPSPPEDPLLSGAIGGLYTGMIQPLQPYAIKGTIWYQGEANTGRAEQYKVLFPTLIADWRKAWGQADLPFLFVQIAPWKGITPELREAQLITWQNTPNTAMAVITDCGNAENIHPPLKQPVGLRLSLAARAIAYKEKIEYSGPLYQSMIIDSSKVVLTFTHASKLVAKDGELKGFTIAGADKKFITAKAEIKGNTIIVYNTDVATPVAVRYGWANVPDVNLYNESDLPASPFRTDTFK